jgi:hypothetical protein
MKRMCALPLVAMALSGCMVMVPGHLYPIHGPLSTNAPTPIYDVSLSGVLMSGTMSASLQEGEVYRGSWTTIRQDPQRHDRVRWQYCIAGAWRSHCLRMPVKRT